MNFVEKVYSRVFKHEDRKEAYMMLMKWLGTNILSKKDELCKFTFEIDDVSTKQLPSFKLTLYLSLSEDGLRERTCIACREYKSLFYVKDESDCSNCKMRAYYERLDQAMTAKRLHYGGKLKGMLMK